MGITGPPRRRPGYMASIQIKGEGPGWQVCGVKSHPAQDQVAHWHYSGLRTPVFPSRC